MGVGFVINRLLDYNKDTVAKELRRIYQLLGKKSFTYAEFKRAGGRVSDVSVRKFYGSWNEGLEKAGIPVLRKMNLSDEELMSGFHEVVKHFGRKPTYQEFKEVSKYSITVYVRRYGSYLRACYRYFDWLSPDYTFTSKVSFKTKKKSKSGSIPLTKSRRFDVFCRDNFTCQYCGKHPPDIKLEVDHVIPLSKGGTNDIGNLLTSCYDCNRGKRNKKLPSKSSEM